MDAQAVVLQIQRELLGSKNSAISEDFINALNLISDVVFSRSSGFILEFLQNSEDSGLGLGTAGCFHIAINKDRIRLVHNGRPFDETDVRAVCGIRSSKKPERGTLGYLGIGFKSVFKVSDAPEVHSGGFHFKFDRGHWHESGAVPWQVLPIWAEASEPVADGVTTFIIPFKDVEYHTTLLQELRNLGTELYLFLKWLKKIEIVDETTNETWALEDLGEQNDITTLQRDGTKQSFRFFRKTITVPDSVKRDPLTQKYRRDVQSREISIAFALDSKGDLAPSEAKAMYGGVYSFLPLGEARSGAMFPIQADFLVQPGRDAINYEAKWNHWLVEEVAALCQSAIMYFMQHPKWKFQFLKAFSFTAHRGLESYDKLFGPRLIDPITQFLENNKCTLTSAGKWATPANVVRVKEDGRAITGLISMGLFKDEDEVACVFGDGKDMHLLHSQADTGGLKIKEADRWTFLKNAEDLKKKAKRPDAAAWFRALYLWLHKYPSLERYFYYTWRTQTLGYQQCDIALTSDLRVLKGGATSFFDVPASDTMARRIAAELEKTKTLLHPDILSGCRDAAERQALRSFLTGLVGVQVIDAQVVCREAVLPKLLVSSPKPKKDDLIANTKYCLEKLQAALPTGIELWVATRQAGVRPAKEVLLSTEFHPDQNWETHKQFVSGMNFVTADYLPPQPDAAQLKLWRDFFQRGGVRPNGPPSLVEDFAMNFAEHQLKTYCRTITRVNKANFGYDLEAVPQQPRKASRGRMRIEVKGQTSDSDVELTPEETIAADKHKGNYYVCVVSSIPEHPTMHIVPYPAAPGVGKKDKLTIPIKVWKSSVWP